MSQKNLARMLYCVIIVVTLITFAVYAFVVPELAAACLAEYAEIPLLAMLYVPALIFIELTAVPIVIAIVLAVMIAHEIASDNSFSRINARRMKGISYLALADSLYFLVGITVFCAIGCLGGPVFLASVVVILIGMTVAVCSGALSHLIMKAAYLREENDLTI